MENNVLKSMIMFYLQYDNPLEMDKLFISDEVIEKKFKYIDLIFTFLDSSKNKNESKITLNSDTPSVFKFLETNLRDEKDYFKNDFIKSVIFLLSKKFNIVFEGDEITYQGSFISILSILNKESGNFDIHPIIVLPLFRFHKNIRFCHLTKVSDSSSNFLKEFS